MKEDRILACLKNRYLSDSIYTNIGPVLVAINPFKSIPSLYTEARIREYRGRKYFEMPPHPYALTDETWTNITSYHENQCVIISGESGSGKTETSKIIMQYISSVSGKGQEVQRVKDRMLSSNPILEGFGNAKTVNNNNSSRFGKYMEILFDYGGDPIGGRVSNYLLEKSRVVGPAMSERNFHVFYQLTLGASQQDRSSLYIEGTDYYRYLNSSNCTQVQGINDSADWKEMCESFTTVGLSDTERVEIMRALSIILWLGNLDFVEDGNETSAPSDPQVVAIIAHLLQVHPDVVAQGLCIRTIVTGSGNSLEVFKKPCRRADAEFNRDTLAKAMYSKLFDYLVGRINESIAVASFEGAMIGVLDIFGFEIFESNSFEQLCINFVNERLQQIFIELTLKTEQEEYKAEGIPWTDIDYYNNKPVCDLIEGRPGILSLLDDTCATNKTEVAWVHTMSQFFAQNQCISCGNEDFIVRHYAGEVRYNANSFVVKNKDTLFDDLIATLQQSPCAFVDLHGWRKIDTSLSQKARPPTVGKVFREQVKALMGALTACVPHYIRCIKPNHEKSPNNFNMNMIQRQVQYLGLLENVRVRRAGYAYRSTFDRFVKRYGVLSDDLITQMAHLDERTKTVKLCNHIGWSEGQQFAMGKTKIFIREAAVLFNLEELLERKISAAVSVLQNAYRFYLQKRKFMELKACGWDALKPINKERRRLSEHKKDAQCDYLNLRNCAPAMALISSHGKKEDIVFADRVEMINVKERKGLFGRIFSGKEILSESKISIVTDTAVYLFRLSVVKETGVTQVTLHFRAPFADITHINVSPYNDGYMIFHLKESLGVRPTLINAIRKTEFLGAILYATQDTGLKVSVNSVTQDQILVNAKKMTYAQISWQRDDMMGVDQSKLEKIKQDFFIHVATGMSFASIPEPYRPPKVDYSSGGRTVLRAKVDVPGNGVDELTVRAGENLYVVVDASNGWYKCENDRNQEGFVPVHAVERVGGPGSNQSVPARPGNPTRGPPAAPGMAPPAFNTPAGGPGVPPPVTGNRFGGPGVPAPAAGGPAGPPRFGGAPGGAGAPGIPPRFGGAAGGAPQGGMYGAPPRH